MLYSLIKSNMFKLTLLYKIIINITLDGRNIILTEDLINKNNTIYNSRVRVSPENIVT